MFQKHFGGFSRYVNKLRLELYDRNMTSHPNAQKGSAAQESGFTSYNVYYKVKGPSGGIIMHRAIKNDRFILNCLCLFVTLHAK